MTDDRGQTTDDRGLRAEDLSRKLERMKTRKKKNYIISHRPTQTCTDELKRPLKSVVA
jgi:hypothetical protein